ncbi:hypothetical protein PQ456_14020 [Paenibacillus kyungheensis]|uniref:Uncharacterized protein n=1 Tax=Paenibacillus kyungheensis TaxID=1452732 RepID=A0AAX3LXA7_9BACL|nr:hypothetical protein [Paenibacillus kyungheensis]WCT54318.1 hypothetical protein PQ456_14020 [Paenibacillus kyungheensis]
MKKLALLFVVVFCFALPNYTYAATLGQVLKAPEEGWQRIDDKNSNIQYVGSGWSVLNRSEYYLGSRHNSTNKQLNDKIIIKFEGTKFRIISSAYSGYTDNLLVTIDGVSEKYAQTASSDTNQALTYEKQGLSKGFHIVEISKQTSGKYELDLTLDAIDIDATGIFLDPNTPVPTTPDETIPAPSEDPTPTTPEEPTTSPQPSGKRALLVVTLDTGLEKEFDLTSAEVQDFITWYELKEAGTGKAVYAIDKHDNNKGPFTSRKDYIIFNKVLTFEVSEYSK